VQKLYPLQLKNWCLAFALCLLVNTIQAYGHSPFPLGTNATYIPATGEHKLMVLDSGAIEIQNGAKFMVLPEDVGSMQYWQIGDHLTFAANSSFFADSKFRVVNFDRNNESVRADLTQAPSPDLPTTKLIEKIDQDLCEVILVDGERSPHIGKL